MEKEEVIKEGKDNCLRSLKNWNWFLIIYFGGIAYLLGYLIKWLYPEYLRPALIYLLRVLKYPG